MWSPPCHRSGIPRDEPHRELSRPPSGAAITGARVAQLAVQLLEQSERRQDLVAEAAR